MTELRTSHITDIKSYTEKYSSFSQMFYKIGENTCAGVTC